MMWPEHYGQEFDTDLTGQDMKLTLCDHFALHTRTAVSIPNLPILY